MVTFAMMMDGGDDEDVSGRRRHRDVDGSTLNKLYLLLSSDTQKSLSETAVVGPCGDEWMTVGVLSMCLGGHIQHGPGNKRAPQACRGP